MKLKYIIIFMIALAAIALCVVAAGHHAITVSFAGDILLDRGVAETISINSVEYLFDGVRDIFTASDIAFANLECPLDTGGSGVLKDKWLLFQADPSYAAIIEDAGLSILNLANNHSMDYGNGGLESTIKALQANGISALGAGTDKESANQPVYIKQNGVVVGFLGFSDFPPEGYFYNSIKYDIAYIDRNTIADAIKDAKSDCDILIVSFHWGVEFTHDVQQEQINLAHMAIDSGADLIVGHHPHVLQGIELYDGKPIFYSLGNFIFDKQSQQGTDETIIVNIKIKDKVINEINLIPIQIINCQPVRADKTVAENILGEVEQYSSGVNIHRNDAGEGIINFD